MRLECNERTLYEKLNLSKQRHLSNDKTVNKTYIRPIFAMILRIFLPKSFYQLKLIHTSKCYHVFGSIISDNDGENVSIYIIDIRESSERIATNRQLIGKISSCTSDLVELPSDNITFRIDDKKSTLKLNTLQLPNFIPTGTSFRTQIFLYDSKAFSELSMRTDEIEKCPDSDPISKLVALIGSSEEDDAQANDASKKADILQNRIIPILMSLSMFIQVKLPFLKSAFVNHFHFWVSNLEKLAQKK